jgi:hypothetical protein
VVESLLVYAFALTLGLHRFPSGIGALVFALHGTRAEPVSWVAADFDLLACLFALLSLLAAIRYAATSQRKWYLAMIIAALLACLSKESAFCLPFLTLGIILFQPSWKRNLLRASAGIFATCVSVFLYRWWLLNTIGGYSNTMGESALAHFNLIRTMKALFFRQWALLFFPINWSSALSGWTDTAVVLFLVALIGFLIWSKPPLRLLSAAIVFLLCAEIPVHHMLLMTADLSGSRVLYLPLLGMALFWCVVVQGIEKWMPQIALSSALLFFQAAALIHNLWTWREVAFLAQRVCRMAAMQLDQDDRPAIIYGLPVTWHGVFFLANGFPECVQMNSPHPLAARIYVNGEQPSIRDPRTFEWNNQTGQLQSIPAVAHGQKQ